MRPARTTAKGRAELKPTEVLYDVRRSVSEILDRPFTERIDHHVYRPDQKVLALWASDCAERVLPYFEEKYPNDGRPRKALEALHAWIDTGVFKMADICKVSLDAHAAARKPRADGELDACFAAHAAGQAVGTAHVPTHALGSSIYGIRAVTAHSGNVDEGVVNERDWQLRRLREYAGRMPRNERNEPRAWRLSARNPSEME